MNKTEYNMEFVTPCFSAGADQSVPELRASAVRGQLRWWFRALSGTPQEETELFGGSTFDEKKTPVASKVVIRVSSVKDPRDFPLPEFKMSDDASYVWYYARVSGLDPDASRSEKERGGVRWKNGAYFSPHATWRLSIIFRMPLGDGLAAKFQDALRCFLALGGIGMRITRGLGAFACAEQTFDEPVKAILTRAGFAFEVRPVREDKVYSEIGSLVKGTRKSLSWKNTDSSQTPSPLGSSQPRQTSAVYFRPVRAADGNMSLVVFAAPYDRVLGVDSRKERIVGVPSLLCRARPVSR